MKTVKFLLVYVVLSMAVFFALNCSVGDSPVAGGSTDNGNARVIEASLGVPKDLPHGYTAFSTVESRSLCISPLSRFDPQIIPNTRGDAPTAISISEDGQWILYTNSATEVSYVIRTTGACKTRVPVRQGGVEVRFYYSSPFGNEIFYVHTKNEMRAISVDLTDSSVTFGTERTILRLSDSLELSPTAPYGVAKAQVFGSMNPVVGSEPLIRTGFVTIPNGGTGAATDTHLFNWANDELFTTWGCWHTLSWCGNLAVANAGVVGGPDVPKDHKGFYVAPFLFDSDTPIELEKLLDSGTVSLNWCPAEFQYGSWNEVNFREWQFANDSNFVIGVLKGTLTHVVGLWVVHWPTNTWTLVNPREVRLQAKRPAVYMGDWDSILVEDNGNSSVEDSAYDDPFDPRYSVVSPNGGEIWYTGSLCTLRVSSENSGNASVRMTTDGGLSYVDIPELTSAINPKVDSVFVFSLLDTLEMQRFDEDSGRMVMSFYPLESEFCKIRIEHYGGSSDYYDESDHFFSIRIPVQSSD